MSQRLSYCDLLGVSELASADEIQHAFRRRAKELHPDHHQHNPTAATEFRRLMEARAYLLEHPYEPPRAEAKAHVHRPPPKAYGPERTMKMERPPAPFPEAKAEARNPPQARLAIPPQLLQWQSRLRALGRSPVGVVVGVMIGLTISLLGFRGPATSALPPEMEAIDQNWFLTSSAPGAPPLRPLSRQLASVGSNNDPDPAPGLRTPSQARIGGKVWFVDPKRPAGSHASSIGEALAQAADGDEIVVASGTYNETLVVTKSVHIRAAEVTHSSPQVTVVSRSSATIELKQGALFLEAIAVLQQGGLGQNGRPSAAVMINTETAFSASGVTFQAPHGAGLYQAGGRSVVEDSLFGGREGVWLESGLLNCKDCTAAGTELSARFEGDAHATLTNFRAAGGTEGGLLLRNAQVTIFGAEVQGSQSMGVELSEGAGLLAERLSIHHCASSLQAAGAGTSVMLAEADFRENNGGVLLDDSARLEVRDSSFRDRPGITAPHLNNVFLRNTSVAGKVAHAGA